MPRHSPKTWPTSTSPNVGLTLLAALLWAFLGCGGLFGGGLSYGEAERWILNEHFTDHPEQALSTDKTAWCRLRVDSSMSSGPNTYTLSRFGINEGFEHEILQALQPGCTGQLERMGAVKGKEEAFTFTPTSKAKIVAHSESDSDKYSFPELLVPCGTFDLKTIDYANRACEQVEVHGAEETACMIPYQPQLTPDDATITKLEDLCGPAVVKPTATSHGNFILLLSGNRSDWYLMPPDKPCSWNRGICD
jgi:hypothetical protein